jgi:hypothetical protein
MPFIGSYYKKRYWGSKLSSFIPGKENQVESSTFVCVYSYSKPFPPI